MTRVQRLLFVLILTVTATLLYAAFASAEDWAPIIQKISASVVKVEMADATGEGSCSGVVINAAAGYVLTAAHCVPDADRPSFTVAGRHAELARSNRLLDLAVLRTELPKGSTMLPLAPSVPAIGSALAVLGYPFGARELTAQTGTVAHPLEARTRRMWVAADLLPGDSGGAIVNSRGELIGITSGFIYKHAAHIGLVVPLETVRAFVASYLPTVTK